MTNASLPTSPPKKSRFRFRCLRKWSKVGVLLFAWLFVAFVWICHPAVAVPFNNWRVKKIRLDLQAANPGLNLKNAGITFPKQHAPKWSNSLWKNLSCNPRTICSISFWKKLISDRPHVFTEALPRVMVKLYFSFGDVDLQKPPDITAIKTMVLGDVGLNLMYAGLPNTVIARFLNSVKGMPLTDVTLDGNEVNDLTSFKGMSLTRLSLAFTKVSDLIPLKEMHLTTLSLSNTNVSDLRPLKEMPLTKLSLMNTNVSDLKPLKGMPLAILTLSYNKKVSNLIPLKGMLLTELYLNYTDVGDLTPLKGMPLTKLWLGSTKVGDATPLKGMPLIELYLNFTDVSDLTPLKGMPLTKLCLPNTKVSNLTPLKGIPLGWLDISNTPAAKKPLPAWLIKSGCKVIK